MKTMIGLATLAIATGTVYAARLRNGRVVPFQENELSAQIYMMAVVILFFVGALLAVQGVAQN
jgi:hypothetical protein